MSRSLLWLALVLAGACGAQLGDGTIPAQTADGSVSQGDAIPTDGRAAWSTPALVPGASSTLQEDDSTLSSNTLELFFKRSDAGDNNLYTITRTSTASAWTSPVPVGTLNTIGGDEESPRLTADDLTMYFGRDGDIYVATRSAIGQPWGSVAAVTVLNTGPFVKWAPVCSNGYVIVSRDNGSDQDLYEGTVTAGANTPLNQFNTTGNEQGTFLSADCLTVYFQSNRTGAAFDIYMATRATALSAWTSPVPVVDFNTAMFSEEDAWISTDQRVFTFVSNVSGTKDVYISTR